MGRKYIPSNGTEGEGFMSAFCYQCIHERWIHRQDEDREEDKCDILSRAFLYNVDDPEYPEEWTYDENGKPTCTNWQKWDWGNDRDGFNEPPEPPPYDPNQLVLFTFDERVDELVKEKIQQEEYSGSSLT